MRLDRTGTRLRLNAANGSDGDIGVDWEDGNGVPNAPTPVSQPHPVSSNTAPWWWEQTTNLISQGLQSYGGAHTGTQVVSSGTRITAITDPRPVAQQQPAYNNDPAYQAYLAQQRGNSGGTLDNAASWLLQPQNLLIGGALLFVFFAWNRDPKKSR